jgi:hypothetical protein
MSAWSFHPLPPPDQLIYCRACGAPIAVKRTEPASATEMVDDLLTGGCLVCFDCGHCTELPLTTEDVP